jgi:GDP-D-mannose dehydratase
MNIVVTGSSGFVGSLLIDTLIEKGHYVPFPTHRISICLVPWWVEIVKLINII